MKEIRTIKMVEQTEVKFVADDGKEFIGENAERDCRDYERQKDVREVKERFERLNKTKIDMPLIDWFTDETDIWKIVLESKQDYYSMTDYFKVCVHSGYFDNYTELPNEFPYTMIVVDTYDYIDEPKLNLKESLQKTLEQLG